MEAAAFAADMASASGCSVGRAVRAPPSVAARTVTPTRAFSPLTHPTKLTTRAQMSSLGSSNRFETSQRADYVRRNIMTSTVSSGVHGNNLDPPDKAHDAATASTTLLEGRLQHALEQLQQANMLLEAERQQVAAVKSRERGLCSEMDSLRGALRDQRSQARIDLEAVRRKASTDVLSMQHKFYAQLAGMRHELSMLKEQQVDAVGSNVSVQEAAPDESSDLQLHDMRQQLKKALQDLEAEKSKGLMSKRQECQLNAELDKVRGELRDQRSQALIEMQVLRRKVSPGVDQELLAKLAQTRNKLQTEQQRSMHIEESGKAVESQLREQLQDLRDVAAERKKMDSGTSGSAGKLGMDTKTGSTLGLEIVQQDTTSLTSGAAEADLRKQLAETRNEFRSRLMQAHRELAAEREKAKFAMSSSQLLERKLHRQDAELAAKIEELQAQSEQVDQLRQLEKLMASQVVERPDAKTEAKLHALERELDQVRQELEIERQQAKAAKSSMQSDMGSLQEQLEALRTELEQERQQAAEALSASKSTESSLQQQLESLYAELESERQKATNAMAAIQAAESTEQRQLEELRSQLEAERGQAAEALAASKAVESSLEQQLDQLRVELDSERQRISSAVDAGRSTESALQKQIEDMFFKLESERQQSTDVVAASKSAEASLQQQLDALRSDLEAERSQAADTAALNKSAESFFQQQLEALRAELESERQVAAGSMAASKSTESALQMQLDSLRSQLEAERQKDTSSLAFHSEGNSMRAQLEVMHAEVEMERRHAADAMAAAQSVETTLREQLEVVCAELEAERQRAADALAATQSTEGMLQEQLDALRVRTERHQGVSLTAPSNLASQQRVARFAVEDHMLQPQVTEWSGLPMQQDRDATTTVESTNAVALRNSMSFDELLHMLQANVALTPSEDGSSAPHWESSEYAAMDVVVALAQHPEAHASGATLVHVVGALQDAARLPSGVSPESVKEALGAYLVKTLPRLATAEGAASLAELGGALEHGQQKPAEFFRAVWETVQPNLPACSVTDSFDIARGVLRSAEHLLRVAQGSGQCETDVAFCCVDVAAQPGVAYSPSDELWSLHASVHAAIFSAAGSQLARTGEGAATSHSAQTVLHALGIYNGACQRSWRHLQEVYTGSAEWLDAVTGAAFPLQGADMSSGQLTSLLENLAAARKASTWSATPRLLVQLDDSITACMVDGMSLEDAAALLSLRASLGPLEAGGALLRHANEVVLMHGAAVAAPTAGVDSSQQLAQLKAQCSLLQVARDHGGLDTSVLINTVCLNLALAGDEVWTRSDFLAHTYPALCDAAAQLGAVEDGSDLQPARYAASVRGALAQTRDLRAQPDHPLNEVQALAGVLRALRNSGAPVDEELLHSFQAHSATRLKITVTNGFVRVKHWLLLLQHLADLKVPCPQMAAVLTWALAHETAPFGRRADIHTVAEIWAKLACSAVGLPPMPPGASSLPGMIEVPGMGAIYEHALVSCLAQGRKMDLSMPSADQWLGNIKLQLE